MRALKPSRRLQRCGPTACLQAAISFKQPTCKLLGAKRLTFQQTHSWPQHFQQPYLQVWLRQNNFHKTAVHRNVVAASLLNAAELCRVNTWCQRARNSRNLPFRPIQLRFHNRYNVHITERLLKQVRHRTATFCGTPEPQSPSQSLLGVSVASLRFCMSSAVASALLKVLALIYPNGSIQS